MLWLLPVSEEGLVLPKTADRENSLTMTMDDTRRHISGFPQATSWFVPEQHLDDPFYSEESVDVSRQTCHCLSVDEARAVGLVKRKFSSITLPIETNETHSIRNFSVGTLSRNSRVCEPG